MISEISIRALFIFCMEIVRCLFHNIEFRLPTTEEEFVSCRLHNEVERLQVHHDENPNCKLLGDINER